MSKVLCAGDIHGDTRHMSWLFNKAKDEGCSHIISVGDFGYFPDWESGPPFLKYVYVRARELKIHVLWIEGNHDDHRALGALLKEHGDSNPIPTPNEWVQWIPRGCRFTIGDTSFMGYGGTWSPDWAYRVKNVSWWSEELIDEEHVWGLSKTHIDVLITHDAPTSDYLRYIDEYPEGEEQRRLVREIMLKVRPKLLVCGHHHMRKTWVDEQTRVEVLSCNGDYERSVLLVEVGQGETNEQQG